MTGIPFFVGLMLAKSVADVEGLVLQIPSINHGLAYQHSEWWAANEPRDIGVTPKRVAEIPRGLHNTPSRWCPMRLPSAGSARCRACPPGVARA